MTSPIRISKRKLANPVQAPPDLGYNDPVLEAEARKTRYISLSLKELVAGDAPVQIWTTERPATPPPGITIPAPSDMSSNTSSSDDGFRLDLGKYLAKIPTSNDRALRSKLDRVGSNSPEDTSTVYKEPDTPSSLPPRNTLPKVRSPTYVPPGRRGSRIPAQFEDYQNAIPLVVQAPLPKRSYSSTTTQSLNAVKRSISLRRTASADSTFETSDMAMPFAAVPVPPTVAGAISVAPKKGRPRKVSPESKINSIRPEKLVNTWNSKRIIDSPLGSPSASSTDTGPASTADEASLDDEGDEDFEDNEDDSYIPPSPHQKKMKPPPTSTSRKHMKTSQQGKTRKIPKRGSRDLSIANVAGGSMPVVSQDLGAACDLARYPLSITDQDNSALPYFNERKRTYVDVVSSDKVASLEQAPSRKMKVARPLTLTLKQSSLNRGSVPRLHSPLSQSFYISRDETALNVMPARVHRLVPTLSVS